MPTQSGEFTTTTAPCPQGSLDCPCDANGWCEPLPGAAQPVACVNNYCVLDDCPRGSLACPCYGNGTCDPVEGVPMTCMEDVCTLTIVPAPGTLGGSCRDVPCIATENIVTECTNGICTTPSCPFGSLNCPCGTFGRCADFRGRQLECIDGYCLLDPCTPGQAGCTCGTGANICAGDTVCIDGVCRAPRLEVFVDDERVRACDVVLEELEGQVQTLGWGDEVIGEHYHRSPRLAASFIAREDGPLEWPVFWFEVSTEPTSLGWPNVSLIQSRCFDRYGDAIEEVVIRVEGRSAR